MLPPHRLLHEGGYTIQKNHKGRHYFKRPDRKAVPDCGYHAEDWEDDYSENISVDKFDKFSQLIQEKNSAEFSSGEYAGVNEAANIYYVSKSKSIQSALSDLLTIKIPIRIKPTALAQNSVG